MRAKANGLQPYAYLREVLTRLPYAETVQQLEALLPWHIQLSELPQATTEPASSRDVG